MSVTLISGPGPSYKQSASHPFNLVVYASNYNATNVTQHRVKAIIEYNSTEIVTKYTIVTNESSKYAYLDLSSVMKIMFTLSEVDSTDVDITKLSGTNMRRIYDVPEKEFTIKLSEEYYLSGTFTSSATLTLTYDVLRGYAEYSSGNGYIWLLANWWQVNGLTDFMPFSGKIWQVYPTRAEDSSWATPATHNYLTVQLRKNGGAVTTTFTILRTTPLGVVYFPIYDAGVTDQSDFVYWQVDVGTGLTSGAMTTLEESFDIYKNVDDCVGEGETIMFQDRLFQWSFMHFPKKKTESISTNSNIGEKARDDYTVGAQQGRYKYNLEARKTLTLNTDWMQEEQNPLIEDLIATQSAWLVDPSDGSLEQVTVVPSSLRLKTRWTDNMIQYSMSFLKSINEFTP